MSKFIKGLLIVAAVFVAIYFGSLWYFKQAILREEARVKAAGEPVTQKELLPPEIPEAQNAAVFYQRAMKLALIDKTDISYPTRDKLYSKDQSWIRLKQIPEGLDRLLGAKKNLEALRLLEAGLKRPGCSYYYFDDRDHLFFDPILHLLSLTTWQAGYFIVKGDYPRAEKTLAAGLKFADSLPNDSPLIFYYKYNKLSVPLEALISQPGYRLKNPVLIAEIKKVPIQLKTGFFKQFYELRVVIFEKVNQNLSESLSMDDENFWGWNNSRELIRNLVYLLIKFIAYSKPMVYYAYNCDLKTCRKVFKADQSGTMDQFKPQKYPLQKISLTIPENWVGENWKRLKETISRYQKIIEAMEKKP